MDHRQFDRFEAPQLDGPDYFKKEVRTAVQMTYLELKRYITDLKRSGFDISTLMVDLYQKLSFPLVSFILAIAAIPFFLYHRQRRRSRFDTEPSVKILGLNWVWIEQEGCLWCVTFPEMIQTRARVRHLFSAQGN